MNNNETSVSLNSLSNADLSPKAMITPPDKYFLGAFDRTVEELDQYRNNPNFVHMPINWGIEVPIPRNAKDKLFQEISTKTQENSLELTWNTGFDPVSFKTLFEFCMYGLKQQEGRPTNYYDKYGYKGGVLYAFKQHLFRNVMFDRGCPDPNNIVFENDNRLRISSHVSQFLKNAREWTYLLDQLPAANLVLELSNPGDIDVRNPVFIEEQILLLRELLNNASRYNSRISLAIDPKHIKDASNDSKVRKGNFGVVAEYVDRELTPLIISAGLTVKELHVVLDGKFNTEGYVELFNSIESSFGRPGILIENRPDRTSNINQEIKILSSMVEEIS